MKRALCRTLPILLGLAAAALGQEDVVVKAMRDELARSMAQLRMENLAKPYFIAYWIDDTNAAMVSATLGQLTASNEGRSRMLAVQVRVGDYMLDNTNFVSGRPGSVGIRALPLDDDYDEIRRQIWLATDAEYKQAGAALAAKVSALQRRKNLNLSVLLGDFTRQDPVTVNEPATRLKIDVPALEKLARELSAVFRGYPEILSSGVQITASNATTRLLNSEGTFAAAVRPFVQLQVGARSQAADGAPVEDSFRVCGRSLDALGSDELLARTRALLARVKALRAAPALGRYNGPVLFEDEAGAQVVAQVFAPAVSAMRIPVSGDPHVETQIQQVLDQFGVSLADRLGARVLPEGFDVTDNPLLATFAGVPLVGSRAIDLEGVPARETKLVGNGWLTALLATRTPTAEAGASTGSASTPGTAAPSNLVLTARKPRTATQLRQELLRIAHQRGAKFGVVVRHVGDSELNGLLRLVNSRMSADGGGGTIAAYMVFDDGHEELARAEIAPVPVAAFKDIVAAGDKPGVYHIGSLLFMGSVTGGAPSVSWSSYIVPPLLFEEASLKQPTGPSPTSPVVPSPMAGGAR